MIERSARWLSARWLVEWRAVFKRDLAANRLFLPAGLVLGLFAPLSTLFASYLAVDTEGLHAIVASVSALIFGGLCCALLGYSSLAPEVATGRIGYFLARPISSGALWFGRLLARFVIAITSTFLVLVPSLLLGGRPFSPLPGLYEPSWWGFMVYSRPWHWGFSGGKPVYQNLAAWLPSKWLILAGAAVLIFAAAHLLAVCLRLRGPWTLLDLAAVASVWTLMGPTLALYAELGALRAITQTILTPLLVVMLTGWLGGWLQLRWGGVSANRSHGIVSVTLWVLLTALLVWRHTDAKTLAAQPVEAFDDLYDVVPAQEGSWVVMTGFDKSSSAAVTFVVDIETDVRHRLGARSTFTSRPRFSGDGKHLFYWQCEAAGERRDRDCWIYRLDLREPSPRPFAIPLDKHLLSSHRMAFSHDGSKLALWVEALVIIFDSDGRELWRKKLPVGRAYDGVAARLFFERSGDVILLRNRYEHRGAEQETRLSTEVWTLEPDHEPEVRDVLEFSFESRLPSLGRRVVAGRSENTWSLVDLEGRLLHFLKSSLPRQSMLLGDGRLAVMDYASLRESTPLSIYAPPAGAPASPPEPSSGQQAGSPAESAGSRYIGSTSLAGWIFFGGQPTDERLLMGSLGRSDSASPPGFGPPVHWDDLKTFVVDTRAVELERVIEGFAPLPLPRAPGALGSDWLLDEHGFPHRYDAESGSLEPVLAP